MPIQEATVSRSGSNNALQTSASQDRGWERIEAALGNTKGTLQPGGVFKIDLPRTDIRAKIAGISVEPDFALDSEVTFTRPGDNAVMKYELVLLDQEVNPVLSALLNVGLLPDTGPLTALHNHYLDDSPHIMFLHGTAKGNALVLAQQLYQAISRNSKTPFGHGQEPAGNPGFDAKLVATMIGGDGSLTNGILTVTVPRKEQITEDGTALPPAMMFESMFNFQSIGKDKVALIAEIVVLPNEADRVARELRNRNISVTALHTHELNVRPQLYYLHAWATGSPQSLAQSMRAALDRTNSKIK